MSEHPSRLRRGLEAGRRAPATTAIAVACVVAFVATLGLCAVQQPDLGFLVSAGWRLDACHDALLDLGALSVADVWLDGSYWRVATAGLLHGSVLHLALNIWSLFAVGTWVEHAWGSWRLMLAFAVSSVMGCLASQAWAEAPMIVGASAGIMGLAGVLLVVRLAGRGPAAARIAPISARGLGIAIAILVGLGFFVPVIAQAGHLGGLAAGAGIGWAWTKRPGARLGWAGLAGLAAGLSWGAVTPQWRPAHGEFLGFELLERERYEEGARALEDTLASRPDDPVLLNAVAYGYAVAGIELDRAASLVERALADEPDNADYLDTRGWIACRRGAVDAGLEWLERASEASGGGVEEIEGHLRDCATAAASE